MNKTIFKVLPLAAVLLATSCSKDDGNVATDVVNKEPEKTIPVKPATFTVSVSYAPKSISKTTIEGDGTYAETIKEIFEVDDVLRLMNGSQVVAESNALTAADIKTDKSKAEFTFANVAATNYTANTALTVVLTKASTGINPCASEVKVGTTLSAAVQNYGYWTDDKKVTLELFESKKIEEEEAVPVSYKVPDGTTFTLSQRNAFVVIPTNGVCKIGGTQYEEAGVYAIPATTNVKPLFKKEVDAVKGNVYYVSAADVEVDVYDNFPEFPSLDDNTEWDKQYGVVSLSDGKPSLITAEVDGIGYLRAATTSTAEGVTKTSYKIYKLTVKGLICKNETDPWERRCGQTIDPPEDETEWVASSNESVVYVSDNGTAEVLPMPEGVVEVYLKSNNGNYYKVIVISDPEE